jgi:hypothetical protein
LGGLWGLWGVKIILLVGAYWPIDRLLCDKGVSRLGRAGALIFWSSAILAQADLRADLISMAMLSVIVRRLENRQSSLIAGFFLFSVWANLHAGFPVGFFLYGVYGVAAWRQQRHFPMPMAAEFVGAVLGTMINPYGLGLYHILVEHWQEPAMSRYVMEWKPLSLNNSLQIPLIVAITLSAFLVWRCRRRASVGLLIATITFALMSVFSARFGGYFAAVGSALIFTLYPRPTARPIVIGLTLLSLFLVVPVARSVRHLPFSDAHVARRAVDFIVSENKTMNPLRLFNQYEWGGYLGWRAPRGTRVFGDSRYLFHYQLAELQEALQSPKKMEEFSLRYGLDAFLIRRYKQKISSVRVYPDGSTQHFDRPWYLDFFPRQRWALVYWDEQSLIFVNRTKVPERWLSEHEYRWRRPDDDGAFADARARGEIPEQALTAEEKRHAAQTN